jgi:DNA integrity scanning protein DisA with diadenylate cyclase activity
MQAETLDATVRDYINELETRNQELQNQVIEIETNHKQNYQQLYNDYLTLKEQYDLLVYKRFVRSVEQLLPMRSSSRYLPGKRDSLKQMKKSL